MPEIQQTTQSPANTAAMAQRMAINAAWLIKLRWVAAIGQLVTISVVGLALEIELIWAPLIGTLAITVISNCVLFTLYKAYASSLEHDYHGWETILFCVMLLDLLSLTTLLYFSGGITNPFNIFYLVNLSLAAIVLSTRSTWILTGIAGLCVAFLLYDHVPLPELAEVERLSSLNQSSGLTTAQAGLYMAFLTCTLVIVYFTTKLNGELRQREVELRRTDQQLARSEKLEALGTLAAGAAHELSTPLATIAVVAKEVQLELTSSNLSEHLKEDISLIRRELDRCRGILDQMSADAGQAIGEPLVKLTSQQLIEEVLSHLEEEHVKRLVLLEKSPETQIVAPLHMLAQAIRGLIKNAIDASSSSQKIELECNADNQKLIIEIRDQGEGMTPEILSRIGEPFFTTKDPGSGTGLGVFLAKNVIDRLNGQLGIESMEQEGTQVTIQIPRSDRQHRN